MESRPSHLLASLVVVGLLGGPASGTTVTPVTPDSVLPLSNQEILSALGRERTARQQLARQLEAARRENEQRLAEQQAKIVELATALDRATRDVGRLAGSVVDTSGELDRRRASTARANQWLAVAVALAIIAVLAGLGTVARRISDLESRVRALSSGMPEEERQNAPTRAA